MSGCASLSPSTQTKARRCQCRMRKSCGSTWPNAQQIAAPADRAFFGPPSGSFWRQMSKGAFAVAFAPRLLPRPWFGPILTLYLDFVQEPSRAGSEDSKEVHPKAIGVRSIPGGRRRDPALFHHARHMFESSTRTRATADRAARMVPPSASSFAGQPSKAGWRTLWAMQSQGRDSIGM